MSQPSTVGCGEMGTQEHLELVCILVAGGVLTGEVFLVVTVLLAQCFGKRAFSLWLCEVPATKAAGSMKHSLQGHCSLSADPRGRQGNHSPHCSSGSLWLPRSPRAMLSLPHSIFSRVTLPIPCSHLSFPHCCSPAPLAGLSSSWSFQLLVTSFYILQLPFFESPCSLSSFLCLPFSSPQRPVSECHSSQRAPRWAAQFPHATAFYVSVYQQIPSLGVLVL